MISWAVNFGTYEFELDTLVLSAVIPLSADGVGLDRGHPMNRIFFSS